MILIIFIPIRKIIIKLINYEKHQRINLTKINYKLIKLNNCAKNNQIS